MKTLLHLQDLDKQIAACKAREVEIPRQKEKFDVQRKRLAAELAECEEICKNLELEQRKCEGDAAEKQAQIVKYEQQLLTIKKNEEYQALIHEIDGLKKQIAAHEERAIAIMVELDDAKARLEEDRKRIAEEQKEIDRQCAEIDAELAGAIKHRETVEGERKPVAADVEPPLLQRYQRIKKMRGTPTVVPLRGETCSGCNMTVRAQIVNEVLAGKIHSCPTCGRLLYDRETIGVEAGE